MAEAHAGFARVVRSWPLTRVLGGLTEARHPVRLGRAPRAVARGVGGLGVLAVDCREVCSRLGDDCGGESSAGRRSLLTLREREMAGLVRTGRANRQIAEAMHLSVKSVEAYLTRVYAKTGCASRLELALALAEGRLDGA